MKPEHSQLRDYARVLWRRKWVVLVVAVLAPLAAVVISMLRPAVYESSAEVLLRSENITGALTGGGNPDRVAQTQARLANTRPVAERAIENGATDLDAEELLDATSVSASTDSDLLTVTARASTAAGAEALANAYAQAYTDYSQELDRAAIVRARQELEQRIAELEAAGQQDSALYKSLVDNAALLTTAETLQTQAAYVIPADEATQVEPKPVRNGLLGAALGLLLGVGLAFLWEALDTRVRSADEIHRRLGLPLLGRIPEPPRRIRNQARLVTQGSPGSAEAEAFRVLRTNIEFANLEQKAHTLMVTSATAAEGKSTTAANLAVMLARGGRRVALVDLDLRRPSIHELFGREQVPGVTDVALGHVELEDALIRQAYPGSQTSIGAELSGRTSSDGLLEVLPSGPTPPDPGEFVMTPALGSILGELSERADLVLIDAPPLLEVGDAFALSARIDALLVVTRLNTLRRPLLNELHRILGSCPAACLGFVVTGSETEDGYGRTTDYGYLARDLERIR